MMIPGQFGLDIFSEIERIAHFPYKLYVIDRSIGELKKVLKEGKGKDKMAAKLAILLVKNKKINIIKAKERYVDKAILDMADENFLIATQDKILREKLKKKGVRIIEMRQKKYLRIV